MGVAPDTHSDNESGANIALPGLAVTEVGLKTLDAASAVHPIDDRLLQGTPAKDLSESCRVVVEALTALDMKRVLQKNTWWHRLTGADVEARLEFDLAARQLGVMVTEGRRRAMVARQAGSLLVKTRARLDADQDRLGKLIESGRSALADADGRDTELRARFERKLANVTALHASNLVTRKQIELAIGVLRTLLDRFTEIERLLMPLWQRVNLAAAQGATSERGSRDRFLDLQNFHSGLVRDVDTALKGKPA